MPLVTVSELLRLALPPGTEFVAGATGSGNAVTWARLLRTRPANLGRIEQGEVWLLSAAALQLVGDARSMARMVRDMAHAGVVAFVTSEPVGEEVYERLLSTLVEDRGLELISNIVAEVTGKAVYLLDEHFQPTLQTGGGERAAEALADVRRRHWEGLLGNVSERLIVVRSVGNQPTAVAL